MLTVFACAAPPVAEEPADLVFRGGIVRTMVGDAASLAVRDGLIVAVGDDLSGFVGRSTEVIEGGTLYPGFVDAHTHVAMSGADALDIDLTEAVTIDELVAAVADRAAAAPDEEWLRGAGWDISLFNDTLHRSQLDAVVSDRGVFLYSADGHSAWVNSAALTVAGISSATPDPEDGRVERDADGEPTGVLREGAVDLVGEHVSEQSDAQLDEGLANALAEAASFGITSIVDANVGESLLAAYQRADDAGKLSMRVYGAVELGAGWEVETVEEIADFQDRFGSERLTVNAAKLYTDGVIESQTAYMIEPYEDGTNGEPNFTDDELAEAVRIVDAAGYQVHLHAIGDGAVRQSLDAIAYAETQNGRRDRRPLLAHLEVIDPDDVVRFATLGALADFQLLWGYPDAYITEWTVPFIGEERAQWLYPHGSVRDAGGTLVAGSDWSVSTMNPWEAIEVAVTRADPDLGGDALEIGQALSVEEAVRAYTKDGALAIFAEADLGTLEVGKLADLVLVEGDPEPLAPEELSEVTVMGTWVGGERVYDRGAD